MSRHERGRVIDGPGPRRRRRFGRRSGYPVDDGGTEGSTATDAADESALARLADSSLLTIARREYRLAVRSRWALGVALLFGLFTTAVVQFGASSVGPGRFDAVVATIAELGVYLVPLTALAVGYDAIVGADERGSLELMLALPVTKGRSMSALPSAGRRCCPARCSRIRSRRAVDCPLHRFRQRRPVRDRRPRCGVDRLCDARRGGAGLDSRRTIAALGAALAIWLWVALRTTWCR